MYSSLLLLLLALPLIYTAQPIYEYLRNLCPSHLLPVTNHKSVRTCDDVCPPSSKCHNGICCSSPPSCPDSSYSYATTLACLPSTNNNCPKGTKCMESSKEDQFICCGSTPTGKKTKTMKTRREGVCPSTHPIALSDPSKGLMLCNDCHHGVCVQFRRSSVMICCQSHDTVCGEGSQVEQRGGLTVDCSTDECSPGFDCTTTETNQRVCCSMGVCASGVRSSRSCAGGCLSGEKCEMIKGERWCCPLEEEEEVEMCPDGSLPSSSCTLSTSAIECPRDQRCMQLSLSAHCCPLAKNRSGSVTCPDGFPPLSVTHQPIECPQIGAPCPMPGYSCQSTARGDLYCCREGEGKTTPSPPPVDDKCPFSYEAVSSVLTGKLRTCTGFLDFTCPFGYTCMPSATTPTFLCCIKKL